MSVENPFTSKDNDRENFPDFGELLKPPSNLYDEEEIDEEDSLPPGVPRVYDFGIDTLRHEDEGTEVAASGFGESKDEDDCRQYFQWRALNPLTPETHRRKPIILYDPEKDACPYVPGISQKPATSPPPSAAEAARAMEEKEAAMKVHHDAKQLITPVKAPPPGAPKGTVKIEDTPALHPTLHDPKYQVQNLFSKLDNIQLTPAASKSKLLAVPNLVDSPDSLPLPSPQTSPKTVRSVRSAPQSLRVDPVKKAIFSASPMDKRQFVKDALWMSPSVSKLQAELNCYSPIPPSPLSSKTPSTAKLPHPRFAGSANNQKNKSIPPSSTASSKPTTPEFHGLLPESFSPTLVSPPPPAHSPQQADFENNNTESSSQLPMIIIENIDGCGVQVTPPTNPLTMKPTLGNFSEKTKSPSPSPQQQKIHKNTQLPGGGRSRKAKMEDKKRITKQEMIIKSVKVETPTPPPPDNPNEMLELTANNTTGVVDNNELRRQLNFTEALQVSSPSMEDFPPLNLSIHPSESKLSSPSSGVSSTQSSPPSRAVTPRHRRSYSAVVKSSPLASPFVSSPLSSKNSFSKKLKSPLSPPDMSFSPILRRDSKATDKSSSLSFTSLGSASPLVAPMKSNKPKPTLTLYSPITSLQSSPMPPSSTQTMTTTSVPPSKGKLPPAKLSSQDRFLRSSSSSSSSSSSLSSSLSSPFIPSASSVHLSQSQNQSFSSLVYESPIRRNSEATATTKTTQRRLPLQSITETPKYPPPPSTKFRSSSTTTPPVSTPSFALSSLNLKTPSPGSPQRRHYSRHHRSTSTSSEYDSRYVAIHLNDSNDASYFDGRNNNTTEPHLPHYKVTSPNDIPPMKQHLEYNKGSGGSSGNGGAPKRFAYVWPESQGRLSFDDEDSFDGGLVSPPGKGGETPMKQEIHYSVVPTAKTEKTRSVVQSGIVRFTEKTGSGSLSSGDKMKGSKFPSKQSSHTSQQQAVKTQYTFNQGSTLSETHRYKYKTRGMTAKQIPRESDSDHENQHVLSNVQKGDSQDRR